LSSGREREERETMGRFQSVAAVVVVSLLLLFLATDGQFMRSSSFSHASMVFLI
jgi:hypothetical protein